MKLHLYLQYLNVTILKQLSKNQPLYKNTYAKNKQLLTKDKKGIYRLNCHECMGCYTRQTRCNSKVRYKEHTYAICNNNEK
jgi:hypothetical protein